MHPEKYIHLLSAHFSQSQSMNRMLPLVLCKFFDNRGLLKTHLGLKYGLKAIVKHAYNEVTGMGDFFFVITVHRYICQAYNMK